MLLGHPSISPVYVKKVVLYVDSYRLIRKMLPREISLSARVSRNLGHAEFR
jgi:hypothetical protein